MSRSVSSEELARVIEEGGAIVVLFSGEWCPDCQRFKPAWNRWQLKRSEASYHVEVSRGGGEWKTWKLQEIPTVAAFSHGAEICRVHGEIGLSDLDEIASRLKPG